MPTESNAISFHREDRYNVIKYTDLDKLSHAERRAVSGFLRRIHESVLREGAPARSFLVIESDWPEYEPVWQMIERRMTGQPEVSAAEELDAVLHWRGKHAVAIKERDALQQRLTAADEQIDLLTPRHTEQPEGKRERFEKWVMATKHPVYGFLDGRSLARGDDRTGYADEYVQGLWVAYLKFGAAQPEGEHIACMPVERCYDVRVKMIIAFNEAKKAGGDLDDALDAAYKSALRFSPNPKSAEQPAPVAVASRDESIYWLKRIDGIGQARAELIYSMGFRRHTDAPQS